MIGISRRVCRPLCRVNIPRNDARLDEKYFFICQNFEKLQEPPALVFLGRGSSSIMDICVFMDLDCGLVVVEMFIMVSPSPVFLLCLLLDLFVG